MARFFIDRPVFAWVIAIGLMLFGGIALTRLPIAQYPSVAPPAVSITLNYPGASAETVQNTVVQVIEQQMSGLDHLLYFTSESDSDGTVQIVLSFAQGTDPDTAQVQVQNKLSLAQPRLPQTVQQQGIRVAKATKNFLLVVGLVSTDNSMTSPDIADYIASHIQDPLSRTNGVGDYQLLGAQYAMRIWMDPAKLYKYSLTAGDVSTAITNQNVQIASGEIGARPQLPDQQLNATLIGPSYLQTPEQFGQILLKVNSDGSRVLLRDVARIELNGENLNITGKINGHPAAGIALKLASGANALDTAENVYKLMDQLKPAFPPGLQIEYPYDTTPFVIQSVHNVFETLFEAIILVFFVMLLFLQNIRATLIPTLAVPVVLLGTFGVLSVLGYSINSLTMFGMVLAIGLLVDDAIVVVENVERVMEEDKLTPRQATRKSMEQITGALVGIALVLSAVFLPMAFFGGSTGVIFRQFSVTIVTSMALSVLVAIVFTPALCATILKASSVESHAKRGFFGWFNRVFDRGTHAYTGGVRRVATRPKSFLLLYVLLVAGMGYLFVKLPTGFLPDEDQGIVFVQVTLPPGATAVRMQHALDQISDYLHTTEKAAVDTDFAVNGFSFSGRGQSSGIVFVHLRPWDERKSGPNSSAQVAGRIMQHFAAYRDGQIFAFQPPAILELGNATGFDFELLDRAGLGHEALMAARNQLLGMASKDPRLFAVRPNGLNDVPQYKLDIDWEKASALGVSIADINTMIGSAFGANYVNQFLDRGRVKRVYIEGDTTSRMTPGDLAKWYVRNSSGTMVPFTAFGSGSWIYGSPKLERYGGTPSVEILGQPAPGQSSGTAMQAMEEMASKLPTGFGYEWTGMSYEEVASGNQTTFLYLISLVVVFLCLAALYESWSIPAAVMMVVPLGVLGALAAVTLRGLSNDVYFQVGLLTTIGLSAKNAILIVEFAKENFDRGDSLMEAAVHAAHQRLRPILMTSLAFILGVLPLAVSTGAGAGGQHAIGTGVVGGMLTATFLAIFFVPMFFVVVLGLFRVKRESERLAEPTPPTSTATEHS